MGAQGYTSSTLTPTTAPPHSVKEGRSAVVGFTEPQEFVDGALLPNGFDVKKAAGAGYKLLCVAKVSSRVLKTRFGIFYHHAWAVCRYICSLQARELPKSMYVNRNLAYKEIYTE